MKPGTISKEITIHAPITQVWQFVGTEAALRQWWRMDITMEAKAGGRCMERGQINGLPYQLEGLVTRYDPPRHLALLLAGHLPGAEQPTQMNIRITLDEADKATLVRVVHQISLALPMPATTEPESVVIRPVWQLPNVMNQLPGRFGQRQVTEFSPTTQNVSVISQLWSQAWENCWAERLKSLQELTKGEE
ncbi:MAG: SRPBCC domain-containing protein [Caldilineaceae bacterium]